jgi:uncharacterized membrane protein YgcG
MRSRKSPLSASHSLVALLLPLKTILRIITFIVSFIMGDFFVFKNKCWLTELYLVYESRLHVNVLKGQVLYFRCRRSSSQRGRKGGGGRGSGPALPGTVEL